MPANKPPVSVDELAEQFFEWDGPKTPYVTLTNAKMFAEEYAKQAQPAVPSGAVDLAKRIASDWSCFHDKLTSYDDTLQHTISRITAYAQQGDAGWQDIATAPKDGTKFIANTYMDSLEGFDGAFICKWHKEWTDKGFVNVHHLARGIVQPTHWQPLPAAPEAQQEKVG